MFLEGIEGRFFRPLGIAFIVSILASLVVALTVTPAMCRYLLTARGRAEREARDAFLVRLLKRIYEPTRAVSHPLPRTRARRGGRRDRARALARDRPSARRSCPSSTRARSRSSCLRRPAPRSRRATAWRRPIERQLLQVEGVRSVTRRTGRAERDEHAEPVSNSEIDVTVKPGYDNRRCARRSPQILEGVPGITTNIGQPIEHRLSHILSGTPAAIAISVYGDDLDVLRTIAKEIEAALKPLPGARDVAANREVMIQSLPVEYRPQELAAFGLTPEAAAAQVRNAIFGVEVAEINEGVRRFALVVRLDESERDTIEDLRKLVLRGKGGALVRLDEVADIGPEMASNLIARENAQRKAVVSLNVAEGYNLGHLVGQVRERVDPIVQEHGYTVKYGGQFEAQQSASRTIMIFSGIVVLVMLVLLHLAIGSIRVALLVMVNLPLALIGGIVAIFLTESPNPLVEHARRCSVRRALHGAGDLDREHGRLHHAVRHRRAQRHPARQPLSAPRGGGGRDACTSDRAGLDGAAGADPDDGAHCGAGAGSHRPAGRQARQRDPRAAVRRHSRRSADLDLPEPGRRARRVCGHPSRSSRSRIGRFARLSSHSTYSFT